MNYLTSFSSKAILVIGMFLGALLPGCALIDPNPPLQLHSLDCDKKQPQPAVVAPIRWSAETTGGKGVITYTFLTLYDSVVSIGQDGPRPYWDWVPKKPGKYRAKVVVSDEWGVTFESKWSDEFTIIPPIARDGLIAVLPIDNLSGGEAPLDEIRETLGSSLSAKGFQIMDTDTIEQFRKKNRMRHTGGVSRRLAKAMQEETGAEAFFITSLLEYADTYPPKVSLVSRLVLTGRQPKIFWIDSVGLVGNQSPGLLGLGLIKDPGLLTEKTIDRLSDSLVDYYNLIYHETDPYWEISVKYSESHTDVPMKPSTFQLPSEYMPSFYFRSPIVDIDNQYTIAVIPLLNQSISKNAGRIIALHYIRELFNRTNFTVLEPGLVREELLRFRAIMPAGPSLALADLITSEQSLRADLVLSGKVFDLQNMTDNPKINFSMQVIEGLNRKVVFSSRITGDGEKGVVFFDVGKIYSAHKLLAKMTKTTTRLLSTRNLP